MIGIRRLENLEHCVRTALADGVPGDFIGTGVWHGGACIFMRAVLKAYRVNDRLVWVADSFQGMPKAQESAHAGGGESGESPQQAAVREACEELGLDRTVALYPLQTTASIPARFFADRDSWPAGTYVVPEYSFAADLTDVEIKLSDEHTAVQWLDYKAASDLLRFDSNRTAVGELHERLLAADLPRPVE